MNVFIDSGAFIGRQRADDQHHRAALAGWAHLEKSRARLFTSNFVLDEAITLLSRRAGASFAAAQARVWYSSAVLGILRPDADDEQRALDLLEKFADQAVSFTDCVSFVLMRREHIKRAFAFDRHFKAGGFELFPGR